MTMDDAVREIREAAGRQIDNHKVRQILAELVEMVKEDCAKSCEKTAQNWSANNDDYKAVALTCAEDIRKIRYLIRN